MEENVAYHDLETVSDYEAVVETNNEAVLCRRALAETRLLPDPYLRLFHIHIPQEPVSPLLKRGTFIRTKAIDRILLNIIAQGASQVIVLGAGYDTRWWRLELFKNSSLQCYIEVDFPEVIQRKQHGLSRRAISVDARYKLAPFDLLNDPQELINMLEKSADVKVKGPRTVFLAECCFMYLPHQQVDRILGALGSTFLESELIIYEPLLIINDPFSTRMIYNFQQRGIVLTSHLCGSIEMLQKFLLTSGWSINSFHLMSQLETSELLTEHEKRSLHLQAALDEYEEWNLLGNHYYLAHLKSSSSSS